MPIFYLNKSVPKYIIHLTEFIGGIFIVFFAISLNKILLFLGIACGLIVTFFYRSNHIEIKNVSTNKATDEKFYVAKKNLINIFDDALIRLNSKGQHANGILKETMPSHRVAYEKFRRILEKSKGSDAVNRFAEVWKEYYDTETYGKNPFAKYYTGSQSTQKDKESAIEKNSAILDFVNQL